MNTVSKIIATLSPDDKKRFISSLKKKNKRKDAKNIELFTLLDKQVPLNNLDEVLYGKNSKGAYHALTKRLHDALIDFIASKNMELGSSEEMNALKLIIVSQTFIQHDKIDIAVRTLAKAELLAKKHSLYRTVNDIFQIQLAQAHLHPSLDFNEIHKKYKRNIGKIRQEENLNLFYAAIQNELMQKNPQTSDIIERNLSLYNISINKDLSYHSLFKILKISNQVAGVTRNYYEILNFIEKARTEIETSQRIQQEHLYDHIQILYYLTNTYFRIKDFKKSFAALHKMHDNMLLQNKKYYSVFIGKYLLLENLLSMYSGNLDSAVTQLSDLDLTKFKYQDEQRHDLELALIVALFFNEQFEEALRVYMTFIHSDKWYAKRVGFIWVIKKNLLEILILIELDYVDLVESRLRSFRKKHHRHLIEHDEQRIIDFVFLISKYFFNKSIVHTDQFSRKLDRILSSNNEKEDIFVLSFYAWLASKITGSKTYDTCLELLCID